MEISKSKKGRNDSLDSDDHDINEHAVNIGSDEGRI